AYQLDKWTFTALANQQIRFNLLAAANSGIVFDLTGPGGSQVFSGLSTSSALITLSASGSYVLSVHGVNGQLGAYGFNLNQTSQTALTLGTAYQGSLAGSGQAQLFRVDVTGGRQLLVNLHDTSSADNDELYVKFGAPPTRADYQYRASMVNGDQQCVVP